MGTSKAAKRPEKNGCLQESHRKGVHHNWRTLTAVNKLTAERHNYDVTPHKQVTRIKTSATEKQVFTVWLTKRHLLLFVKAGSLPSVDIHYPLWTASHLVTRKGWGEIPYCLRWRIILAETICSSVLLLSMNIPSESFSKPAEKCLKLLSTKSSALQPLQYNGILLRFSNYAL